MAMTLPKFENYETTTCFRCGTMVVMLAQFYRDRLRDKASWFCINGHPQHFIGETNEERLKKQLDEANRQAEEARKTVARRDASISALKGQATRTKNRIANGVCPCCNRRFVNLGRHMGTKHPDYKKQDIG